MQMKVLQINAVSGISSTGRTCSELSNYLNNHGHEGFVAYSAGISYPKGYIIGNRIDTKVHSLFSRVFGLQAYFSKYATRRLLTYISALKPDIVHLHNLHSNYINLKLLLNYLAENDIPTVITLHDCWFYTGKCTHYTVENCYKWQTGCGGCPRLKKDNPSWFFDQTPTMLEDKKDWLLLIPRLAVVGVSDWITDEARKSFLSSANVLTRIYNWIDLKVFKPVDGSAVRVKLGITDKYIILGVSSVWSNPKGLDKFIKLADIIPPKMQIVLVGTLSSKIKLPENIIHIPETHDVAELAMYYSMADVYVHLSPEETFGKVIAEALSCGTPVIVFNSTACPEVVGTGCGIILNEYQPSAILKAIMTIRENGKSFYSTNAINRAHQNFNETLIMEEYSMLYKQLINYVD
jgi:glycosyltransferase involved in cell wall biosynthesis